MNTRHVALRLIAEAQRTLLEVEARGQRMPRHEQRERILDAADMLADTVRDLRAEALRLALTTTGV